jgi:hypothetical protein
MQDEPDQLQFRSGVQPSDYAVEALGPKDQKTSMPISMPESYFGEKPIISLKQQKGLPPEQHKIIKLKQGFFIWGWVVYTDVFPGTKLHITEFCQKLRGLTFFQDGTLTFEWDTCRHHNCVDDYCEDYQVSANMMPK